MVVMTLKMSCLKQLVDCIDVKIVGHQNINEENIDFKGFVAGYLGQIVKSEVFQSLTTEIRERVGHVYFLVLARNLKFTKSLVYVYDRFRIGNDNHFRIGNF